MASFTGFATLKTPRDLLRKMEHDYGRMQSEPGDEYAAYDFFVTAEHMLDWIHPDRKNTKMRESVRDSQVLLQVTSHIANGAKHFEATDPRHKSVTEIERGQYVELDYVESGYFAEPLVIKLATAEAGVLGGAEIEATELARRVLEYWRIKVP
jgi:hypothetical protein